MDRDIQLEVEELYQQCLESAEREATPPMTYDFHADMGSSSYERSTKVAEALEHQLQWNGVHARVAVKENSETMVVSIFYPGTYLVDSRDGRWFVDQPQGACWYFEASNEASAKSLASFFNSPPHAVNLQALRPHIGIDEASLKLWLLGKRGEGIDVTTFAFKGTGVFNRNNLLS